jgi:hypothetical protein
VTTTLSRPALIFQYFCESLDTSHRLAFARDRSSIPKPLGTGIPDRSSILKAAEHRHPGSFIDPESR